jgi:uncharacterized protein (DUF2237 family)
MALLELHHDHVASVPSMTITPVVIGDWWCRTCGRPEAAEDTRLCPECASYPTRTRVVAARQLAELAAVLASATLCAGAVVLRYRSGRGVQR